MSPALSLSVSHLPPCKSQDLPKDTHLPKIGNRESPCQRTPLDAKLSRRKLLNSAGLGLTGGAVVQPAKADPESPIEATSSRISYSRFLQYLDEDAVKKVDLFENGTVAIAEIFNPTLNKVQRVKIQLPGLPQELLRKLKEKKVDFAAHPMEVNIVAAILVGEFGFSIGIARLSAAEDFIFKYSWGTKLAVWTWKEQSQISDGTEHWSNF